MFGLDVPYTKAGATVLGQAAADNTGLCGDPHALQQMLVDLGYPVGAIDGVIGNATLKAVHQLMNSVGVPYSYPLKAGTCQAVMDAWTAKMAVATPAAKAASTMRLQRMARATFKPVTGPGGTVVMSDVGGGWWAEQTTITKVAIIGGGVAVIGVGVYLVTKKKATPNRRRRRRS